MGGLWVLIDFQTITTKEKFMANTSVVSWFSHLQQAMHNVFIEERAIWVNIDGVPLKVWTKNTFNRTVHPSRRNRSWGVWDCQVGTYVAGKGKKRREKGLGVITECVFESLARIVPLGYLFICTHGPCGYITFGDLDTIFENSKSQNLSEAGCNVEQKHPQSEDPFNLYDLLNKKNNKSNGGSSSDSNLKYPPGFTPSVADEDKREDLYVSGDENEIRSKYVQVEVISPCEKEKEQNRNNGWHNDIHKPVYSGGSILQVMEDMVKVGKTMGYNMEGCLAQKTKKVWVKELCVRHKVNFLSLQETKLESLEFFNIRRCWGNFNFDYVYSSSVGYSGGILCVWDPKMFHKDNATVSDYFVMVRGKWIPNGRMILIISIYAPQELSEKKMLWDYLTMVIGNWQGDVVIMGDFNEVRKQEERYGSVFNVHGADAFNMFISNAGLEEIHLGGCSFTWCHKSASKMSKLDRFLVSEGI
ncbi:RNA-directed DNA polymerase, eukaryota, partial [Tanacetum coccineum]